MQNHCFILANPPFVDDVLTKMTLTHIEFLKEIE